MRKDRRVDPILMPTSKSGDTQGGVDPGDDDQYSKESLAELHDRINRILKQLPAITGWAAL